jgi:hypothetical protein
MPKPSRPLLFGTGDIHVIHLYSMAVRASDPAMWINLLQISSIRDKPNGTLEVRMANGDTFSVHQSQATAFLEAIDQLKAGMTKLGAP